MPRLFISNEFSRLSSVILGISSSMGGTPELEQAYDPKSKEHIKAGTFPTEQNVKKEIDEFRAILEENNIKVYRPESIENYNQIFARDIGCVIEDKFIITNTIEERSQEINALSYILTEIPENQVIKAPTGVRFEGGDIMPHNDHIFIGFSKEEDFKKFKVSRTNQAGVDFIKALFPNKTIKAIELNKSDSDPKENALHLDCCFQPFGLGHAIIHENGFKNSKDYKWFLDFFGQENCLTINKNEMYDMGCNLFSISKDHIISDNRFGRINKWLRTKGYKVSEITYGETSKMEGLLRCSTLPLCRQE